MRIRRTDHAIGGSLARRSVLGARGIRWFALLLLCAAYLQGSLTKLFDWPAATAEMEAFGLRPANFLAVAVIAFELTCSAMILTGIGRWLGALLLAGFTLLATALALRFWTLPTPGRMPAENAFFEHLGLVGGLLLIAWHDLLPQDAQARAVRPPDNR